MKKASNPPPAAGMARPAPPPPPPPRDVTGGTSMRDHAFRDTGRPMTTAQFHPGTEARPRILDEPHYRVYKWWHPVTWLVVLFIIGGIESIVEGVLWLIS